jgi:hypothetical protein
MSDFFTQCMGFGFLDYRVIIFLYWIEKLNFVEPNSTEVVISKSYQASCFCVLAYNETSNLLECSLLANTLKCVVN